MAKVLDYDIIVKEFKPQLCYYVYFCGGARGVMVIVVGNEHGDTSSNPRQDIAFPIALIPLGKV